MAESVQNTDVEDVLSSIRRLVAETSSKSGKDAEAVADEIAQDAEKDALLLTSSQRVAKHDAYELADDPVAEDSFAEDRASGPDLADKYGSDKSAEFSADAEAFSVDEAATTDLGELRLALKRKAEEAQEEASDTAQEPGEDSQPMFSKLPKSRLHLSDAMITAPGSKAGGGDLVSPEDVFALHVEPDHDAAPETEADAVVSAFADFETGSDQRGDEPAEPWNVALPEDYYEDEVDTEVAEADVWVVDDEGSDSVATTAQIYDFDADREQEEEAAAESDAFLPKEALASDAEDGQDDASDPVDGQAAELEVDEFSAEHASEDDANAAQSNPTDLLIVRPDIVGDELTATPLSEDAPVAEEAETPEPASIAASAVPTQPDGGDLGLSEERLTALVRDVVRQELTGEMGTLITKNLRLLVRREINRVLATKEFD